MISKTERTELKTVVRQQFRVLRAELEQREVEMIMEVDAEVSARFADDDENWAVVQHKVHELVMAANRGINDALREHGYQERGHTERLWLTEPRRVQPHEKRTELTTVATRQIRGQAKQAGLALDRQEADLIKNLAVGAIESEEAQAFLGDIPTVGDLVPGARLAELEASLEDGDSDG